MERAAASLLYRAIRSSSILAALTQTEIAKNAKIHQSQVSRIMSGQFKRTTARGVLQLCELAGIPTTAKTVLSLKLQNTLQSIWDGSRAQEDALVKLLKAADALALARSAKQDRSSAMSARKRAR
jgi:predicted XRE-type DNA-binding protein